MVGLEENGDSYFLTGDKKGSPFLKCSPHSFRESEFFIELYPQTAEERFPEIKDDKELSSIKGEEVYLWRDIRKKAWEEGTSLLAENWRDKMCECGFFANGQTFSVHLDYNNPFEKWLRGLIGNKRIQIVDSW